MNKSRCVQGKIAENFIESFLRKLFFEKHNVDIERTGFEYVPTNDINFPDFTIHHSIGLFFLEAKSVYNISEKSWDKCYEMSKTEKVFLGVNEVGSSSGIWAANINDIKRSRLIVPKCYNRGSGEPFFSMYKKPSNFINIMLLSNDEVLDFFGVNK